MSLSFFSGLAESTRTRLHLKRTRDSGKRTVIGLSGPLQTTLQGTKCFPLTLPRRNLKTQHSPVTRKVTWLSWLHHCRKVLFSKCFLSTRKWNAGVFKFLRFEERFHKAPFFYARLEWMVGLTGEIKLQFQITPASCGWALIFLRVSNVILSCMKASDSCKRTHDARGNVKKHFSIPYGIDIKHNFKVLRKGFDPTHLPCAHWSDTPQYRDLVLKSHLSLTAPRLKLRHKTVQTLN